MLLVVTLKVRNIMHYSKEMWNSLIKTGNVLEFSRAFRPHLGGSISRVFRQFLEVNPPNETWSSISQTLRSGWNQPVWGSQQLPVQRIYFQLNCPGNCMISGTFWNFPKYLIPKSVNSAHPSEGSHSIFLPSCPRVSLIIGTAMIVFRLTTGGKKKEACWMNWVFAA